MSTPIRLGGPAPQLVQSPSSGAPAAQVSFSSLIQSSVQAPAPASGITGRQVVAAALKSAGAAARAVGGPIGQVVGAAADQLSGQAQLQDLLDKTRQILLTNAIFDTSNQPTVERELETGI